MTNLPSGIVTVLFADLEGSSPLWERFPEEMADVLDRFWDLSRAAVEAERGAVIKAVGDEIDAVFPLAIAAVRAAIASQRAVLAEPWGLLAPGLGQVRVRMALHTGSVVERAGDLFGPTINRVSRLLSSAHGGQVLITRATEQMVREYLPEGVRLRDRGEVRFKGLQHSERVFQVVAPGMPDVRKDLRPTYIVTLPAPVWVESPEDQPPATGALPGSLAQRTLDAVRRPGGLVTLTPEQATELARQPATDLTAYRLGRVASWSLPRHRLEEHFVRLSLLVDHGDAAEGLRWRVTGSTYDDLGIALADTDAAALVVLGPPGSGKSTLLGHLDLDLAIAGLRGVTDTVAIHVPLRLYAEGESNADATGPLAWLDEQWRLSGPGLPSLDSLLTAGRATLLLDGLNEMPHSSYGAYRGAVLAWKRFLRDSVVGVPGNRVIFTCRSLDYSAPLSSPDLPVPQLQIRPMDNDQVRRFLDCYSPAQAAALWEQLHDSPVLETLRNPYFLRLLVEHVHTEGYISTGRAALLTSFAWNAIRRELERDNPLFAPDGLLTERDARMLLQGDRRLAPTALPEGGLLVPKLAQLAFGMQRRGSPGESSQLLVAYDTALRLLGHGRASDVLTAGAALGLLDEDATRQRVGYVHQLMQEYFVARHLARHPSPSLVRAAWRARDAVPSLDATVAGLAPADPLPPMPGTHWDEAMVMASAVSDEPEQFVAELAAANLALAARCAALPEVPLPSRVVDEIGARLLARSRDPDADLRARIEAGRCLGALGDPRLRRVTGPEAVGLTPPLIRIQGGTYLLGAPDIADASPAHRVVLAPFQIATLPVTNAEWACFTTAGGYDEPRWWDTPASAAWRSGQGTAEAAKLRERRLREEFLADPASLDRAFAHGHMAGPVYQRWRQRLDLTEAAFEAHLDATYPGGRLVAPQNAGDERFNHASLPVVGVSWFEARAYAAWLANLTGQPYRLPTEAEWEAAARGAEGRAFAWGHHFDRHRCNCSETHVRCTTPVGIFPAGDTPEGCSDLSGNVFEWTSSLWGADRHTAAFGYPYSARDGRENAHADNVVLRVLRGGAWDVAPDRCRAASRTADRPDIRGINAGFRLAVG